jgi:hypothetical protein
MKCSAIFVGAGLGALLRWRLRLTLNGFFPSMPPGTLAAILRRPDHLLNILIRVSGVKAEAVASGKNYRRAHAASRLSGKWEL